ncbi:MAG: hypothetical protein SFV81_28860 [Pirellulaceae bacterium]|nr:hypothetical protein [Pirellulaceae bacterium]
MDSIDWLQRLYPESLSLWSYAICCAAILFGVAAFWWIRIPGGVHPAERSTRRSISHSAFAFLGTIACPTFMAVGIAYLLFPVTPPRILVLSSRVRPETDSWTEEWKTQFERAVLPGMHAYDAGAVVDEVCAELVSKKDTLHFDHTNPQAVADIRRVVSEHLLGRAPQLHRVDRADFASTVASNGSAKLLPVWVVQSVEITVLKLLTEQYNVARIASRFSDSSGGAFPASSLREFLAQDCRRHRPIDVENIVVAPRQSEVELSSILAVRSNAGGTAIDAMLFSDIPRSETLILEISGNNKQVESATLAPSLPRGFSVQQFQFAPPISNDILLESVANLTDDPTVVRSVPRDPKSLPPIQIRFSGSRASSFESTFQRLLTDTSSHDVLEWRERMLDFGLDANPTRFVMAASSADVVIVCEEGFVAIGKAMVPGSLVAHELAEHRPYRGQSVRGAAPGVYSLNKLQFRRNSTLSTPDARLFGQPVGNIEFMGPSLVSCSIPLPSPTHKLLQAPVIGSTTVDSDQSFFIGFDFQTQSMLFDAATDQPNERMLAVWTLIIEAAFRVKTREVSDDNLRSDSTEIPILLINDDATQSLQSRTIASNLVGYSIAALTFALFILRGVTAARRRL